jgi:hypothetical protein
MTEDREGFFPADADGADMPGCGRCGMRENLAVRWLAMGIDDTEIVSPWVWVETRLTEMELINASGNSSYGFAPKAVHHCP